MDVEKLSQEINQLSQIKWLSHDDAVIVFEFARCVKLLTAFEAKVRADERKSPTITKLMEAARNFAARVEERNPEWFREERGTTDFSEADHALRAALAALEKP